MHACMYIYIYMDTDEGDVAETFDIYLFMKILYLLNNIVVFLKPYIYIYIYIYIKE